jgi:HlyD family secretion protein
VRFVLLLLGQGSAQGAGVAVRQNITAASALQDFRAITPHLIEHSVVVQGFNASIHVLPKGVNLPLPSSPAWLRSRPWLIGVAAAVLLAGSGALLWSQRQQRLAQELQRQAALERPITTVTALGRLEPVGEVIQVVPPSAAPAGAQVRLRRLLVDEGDPVEPGQLLAELDSLPRLSRAVDEAAAQVAIAETQLRLARARQHSQLAAQRARVASAEAAVRAAAAEERRYRQITEQGAASASLYESRRLELETAQAKLSEARAELEQLEVTVATGSGRTSLEEATARRDLDAARAHLQRTRAERDDALVRSPIRGRVLSVLARPGESAGPEGLLELGQTERMQLVAEVYQSDRRRLRLGQPVRITSPALSQPLLGHVTRIGAIVRRQSMINTDPSANTDARVIEVHAELDPASSLRAADLSNLQVTAVFGS